MAGYVSRKYLNEKYSSLKWDMENVLNVLDENASDSLNTDDVLRVLANIKDKTESIINELENAKR